MYRHLFYCIVLHVGLFPRFASSLSYSHPFTIPSLLLACSLKWNILTPVVLQLHSGKSPSPLIKHRSSNSCWNSDLQGAVAHLAAPPLPQRCKLIGGRDPDRRTGKGETVSVNVVCGLIQPLLPPRKTLEPCWEGSVGTAQHLCSPAEVLLYLLCTTLKSHQRFLQM